MVWIRARSGGQWFAVAGILEPAALAPEVDIGAVAGLVPALRAARLSPTEALRTV